jgi:hypothetical protein
MLALEMGKRAQEREKKETKSKDEKEDNNETYSLCGVAQLVFVAVALQQRLVALRQAVKLHVHRDRPLLLRDVTRDKEEMSFQEKGQRQCESPYRVVVASWGLGARCSQVHCAEMESVCVDVGCVCVCVCVCVGCGLCVCVCVCLCVCVCVCVCVFCANLSRRRRG